MNAAEARRKSVRQATLLAKKKAIESARRKLRDAKSRITRSQKFLLDFEKELCDSIAYATEEGERSVKRTLSEDHKDLVGQPSYAPEGKSIYGPEQYFKYAKFGVEVKKIVAKLRRDDFKVEVGGERVEHDDSAAYMNSGGECGSDVPYYTDDTILRITW